MLAILLCLTLGQAQAMPPRKVLATVGLPDGGVQLLQVEGRGGGPVLTELTPATLSTLSAPVCIIGDPSVVTLTTTPTAVPAVPLASRTQLRLTNLSGNHNVWCRRDPGDGGVPDATHAHVLLTNGGYVDLPVRADIVRCRSATATADLNIEESSCAQP